MCILNITGRCDVEEIKDSHSITDDSSPMDIKSMLERASLGILDLESSNAKLVADTGENTSIGDLNKLLDRKSSVMDNAFGASFERVRDERDALLDIAEHNIVDNPQPSKQDLQQPKQDPQPPKPAE